MPLYALLLWLIIGAAAGWMARRLLGTEGPWGLAGDIVVGLIGAVIGGYILGLFGASGGGGAVVSLLTALVGAVALLFVVGKLIKPSTPAEPGA